MYPKILFSTLVVFYFPLSINDEVVDFEMSNDFSKKNLLVFYNLKSQIYSSSLGYDINNFRSF